MEKDYLHATVIIVVPILLIVGVIQAKVYFKYGTVNPKFEKAAAQSAQVAKIDTVTAGPAKPMEIYVK